MSKAVIVALLLILSASALKFGKSNTLIQLKNKNQVETGSPDFVTIETGELQAMAEDANHWYDVTLSNIFENPVVLMQMTTYNGGHPCHLRVKNVNSNNFQFKIEEWEYLDEWHTEETIQYIVAEKGHYEMSCGSQMVIGQIGDMHESWVSETFPESFNGSPVVMTQCQTENGGDAVVTRHKDINASSFSVKLQEQETMGPHPMAEIVGYFAVEQGSCDHIVAGNGDNVFDENWETITFLDYMNSEFADTPFAFAQMQTTNGGNTAGMRMSNLTSESCDVFVEEETSQDSETNHVNEVVGFLAIQLPHIINLELEDHCSTDEDDVDMCEYIYDCATLEQITTDFMAENDTTGDNTISQFDDIAVEHLDVLISECDEDQDGFVDVCELYQCAVRFENVWRDENCPSAGHVSCDCDLENGGIVEIELEEEAMTLFLQE